MTENINSNYKENCNGSEQCFGAIVAAEIPGLYRYAKFLVGKDIEAEEVVGDTVMRAWEHREDFRGEGSIRTWLHQILRRRAIDRSRHQSHEIRVESIEDDWQDEHYTVDPEKVLARAEVSTELIEALSHIPIKYREAVLLHDVEGWTTKEISLYLSIGISATKQRLRRGRMMLVSSLAVGVDRRTANKGVALTCSSARFQISDYLDGELPLPKAELLIEHLSKCASCPSLYTSLVGVRQSLGLLRDSNDVIPEKLAIRIKEILD